MNILGWLLYLKALLVLLHPVGSMGMWGRLCGTSLAEMMKLVCDGRGYYVGETDSPMLSERQAKAFLTVGRKRTGKIVTECCDNLCNLQIIESYCAPLVDGQEKGPEKHWFLHERERETENEQNNRVEDSQSIDEEAIADEATLPNITQAIVDPESYQFDLEDSLESATNLLNGDLVMLGDQAHENSEQERITAETEDILQKEKADNAVTDVTELQTHDELEEVSENRDRNNLNKTKGNSRTNRPSSREKTSKRKNSREKKKHRNKSGSSRERRPRRRNNKSKNKKNRRRKAKYDGQEGYTQPTSQLITDIEVFHPQGQVVNAEQPSRSEPGNLETADAESRNERSFLTTITAKLLDVMGLQQNSNTNVR